MTETVWKFLYQNVPDFRMKFPLLESPKAITEKDISDLLESVATGKPFRSNLIAVYREVGPRIQRELYDLCKLRRDRSAKIMSGVVYGVLKRVHQKTGNRKLTLGLQGKVMLGLYGYKKEFLAMLSKIHNLDNNRSDNKDSFEIQTVESGVTSNLLGAVAISKYIWLSGLMKRI